LRHGLDPTRVAQGLSTAFFGLLERWRVWTSGCLRHGLPREMRPRPCATHPFPRLRGKVGMGAVLVRTSTAPLARRALTLPSPASGRGGANQRERGIDVSAKRRISRGGCAARSTRLP
jgi:hypothetical protein